MSSGRKHATKRYFPDDYDYTRILQYMSDDESDIELPAKVVKTEEEGGSDAVGDDAGSGSEYRVSVDSDDSDDSVASDGDGSDVASDGNDSDGSDSDGIDSDGVDVGYQQDVAAEQRKRGRSRGRRIFQGRVQRLRSRGLSGRGRRSVRSVRGIGRAVARGRGRDVVGETVDDGWVADDVAPQEIEFTGVSGMRTAVPTTALGFIQLFLTRALLNFLTEETNMYALYCRDVLKQQYALNWPGCTVIDIAHYLGLTMLMGIVRLPNLRMYWSTISIYSQPQFSNVMTSSRYLELSRFLHAFNRRAVPANNTDKLILFRPVMEYLQRLCCQHYIPEQELSLDEGIMPYKGHLSIKVYNPMKPDKYGVKFYFLCEATSGYVYSFSVYRGVSQTLKEIVYNLLRGLLGQGYHVYMDNYYNSVRLARDLYDDKVHCTGTLRLPRGAPPSFKKLAGRRLPRDTYHHRRSDNVVVMCWFDTRLVSLITTFHGVETEVYEHRKRVRRQGRTSVETVALNRPVAIRQYTKYMQGVDRLDQFMKYYSFLRKTRRWTKKILFYFLQIGLQNAYALYVKYTTDRPKMSHLSFHTVAIQSLIYFDPDAWPVVGPLIDHAPDLQPQDPPAAAPVPPPEPGTSRSPPESPPAATSRPGKRPRLSDPPQRLKSSSKHYLVPISATGNQKRCRVCYLSGKRKDTTKQCHLCQIALCARGPCFEHYHKKVKFWATSPVERRGVAGRRARRHQH